MSVRSFWDRWFRPTEFSRREIAAKWLEGDGLEIGALHNPLRVPKKARVTYVDRMSLADLLKEYPTLANKRIVDPKIVDDVEEMKTVPNDSQDFLIANHLIEHVENPIAVIENFLRVLRPGGVIYLAIPDMRSTFDADREETTVAHLLRDYREGPAWSRQNHFEEYVRCVEQINEPAAHALQVEKLIQTNANIHFHCWTQSGMWAWLNALQRELGFSFEVEFYLRRSNEGIFILKKTRRALLELASAVAAVCRLRIDAVGEVGRQGVGE